MRLPVATLMAQYPEDQELDPADRNERIPCILPQVIFINCRIFPVSVVGLDCGTTWGAGCLCAKGDSGRGDGLIRR